MKYTPQKWFCNNCGKELCLPLAGPTKETRLTRNGYTCSQQCCDEFRLKESRSIIGK
jgi:hypothetical protein